MGWMERCWWMARCVSMNEQGAWTAHAPSVARRQSVVRALGSCERRGHRKTRGLHAPPLREYSHCRRRPQHAPALKYSACAVSTAPPSMERGQDGASNELTADLAAARATGIGSSDGGMSFGCTRLIATELALVCIAPTALTPLVHVSHVDVSCNCLTSLAGLERLHALSTLCASHNRLSEALDFAAPAGGSRLRRADLQDNAIHAFSINAPAHTLVEELLLDRNRLPSLEGLAHFPALCKLSCASNCLCDASTTLSDLQRLRSLCLRDNELDDAAVARLPLRAGKTGALTDLDLAENRLTDLRGLLRALASGGVGRTLRHLRLLPGNALEVELGLGVHGHAVVTWGFDDVEPAVSRAYVALVARELPLLTQLDGLPFGPSELGGTGAEPMAEPQPDPEAGAPRAARPPGSE